MPMPHVLNTILFAEVYLLIYTFLGIMIVVMIGAKCYAMYIGHDDIRILYMVYFMIFSLNFFTNCTIFTLRIFQQDLIVLGFGSLIILFLNKFIFDIHTTIKTQRIWSKNVFIRQNVQEWFGQYEIAFTVLSFFFGPVGAVTFCNSRLFNFGIFLMGVPHSMLIHFVGGKLFWEVLVIQRMPELAVQTAYMILHGYDHFVLYGFLTTILSTHVLISMRLQLPAIQQIHKYWVHQTAVLLEVSSTEICILRNAERYALKREAFKEIMAEMLEIDVSLIELPCFEPIRMVNVSDDDIDKSEITKCYGFRAYISVNTHMMPRRLIMMKLMAANDEGILISHLDKIWGLRKQPIVEELVMVYNLFGHLVKPRKRILEEPTITMTPQLLMPTPKGFMVSPGGNSMGIIAITPSVYSHRSNHSHRSVFSHQSHRSNHSQHSETSTKSRPGIMMLSRNPYESFSIKY